MSRSIKKGPYVAPELLKRVEEMNAKGEKNVLAERLTKNDEQ